MKVISDGSQDLSKKRAFEIHTDVNLFGIFKANKIWCSGATTRTSGPTYTYYVKCSVEDLRHVEQSMQLTNPELIGVIDPEFGVCEFTTSEIAESQGVV